MCLKCLKLAREYYKYYDNDLEESKEHFKFMVVVESSLSSF